MSQTKTVSELFYPEPDQLGLRGDPFLWKALRKHLSSTPLPDTDAELLDTLEKAFQTVSGESLSHENDFYVEKFAHGGMSSGYISPVFWRSEALPLLRKHYKERIRFTLERNQWYAAEFLGEEFGKDIRSYSPIKVYSFIPLKNGSRQFELTFYHANYPEGVRDKTYTLKTLERNRQFILAKSTSHKPARLLLIYTISTEWLIHHFDIRIEEGETAESWLERNA